MTCVICKLPIAYNEGFMSSDGPKHHKPQWCIAALEAEVAVLREDKARLVEALERICTHSRDADCGDHCSNACMYCQGRAAIDAARKESRGLRRCGSRGTRTRSRRKATRMPR